MEPAFKYNTADTIRTELEQGATTRSQPKLYCWFEQEETLCLEFHGGYQAHAAWYRAFWLRLRMELGCLEPTSPQGWQQGGGGMAAKVWRLPLASAALRTPHSPQTAYAAVLATVQALNGYPHLVGLLLEAV